MLPKDYLFSPFAIRTNAEMKPKARKTLAYDNTNASVDSTVSKGLSNIQTNYTGMYQNYMYNATEASKSFNYVRADRIAGRPAFITDFYKDGGDTLEKLDTYYDLEDGFNVAGAVMMDEAKSGRRRK